MKNRDQYLKQLINWKDKELIKVITGVRRCGKSSLLILFKEHLESVKVQKNRIIHMNFESMEYDNIKNYKELYTLLKSKIKDTNKKYYLLLDEIQVVEKWEKCVNGMLVAFNVDIYITGSNAYLLSSELSTLLSGRYVEIKMLPLSFKEYLEFCNITNFTERFNIERKFEKYIQYGGLPAIAIYEDNIEILDDFLVGIYNTVVIKDIIQRNQVRDSALLESLIRFLAANIGNIVSTKKISDYLTSAGRKTTSETIDNYLKMVESSYILYKVNRYDLKGKMFLKTLEKYYIVDMGIRNILIGKRDTDIGHVLENIVYLELIRRGYQVSIGKIGKLEIDFIATKFTEKKYIQVTATMIDESTRERELRSLRELNDNYEKTIITMDKVVYDDFEGIKVVNIIDFLLE